MEYTPDALGHKPTDLPDTKLDAERTLTDTEREAIKNPLAVHEGGQPIEASSEPRVEGATGTPHNLQTTPGHLQYLPHEHAQFATRAAVDETDSHLSLTEQAKHVHAPHRHEASAAKKAAAFYDEDATKPIDPNDAKLGDALVELQGTLGDGQTQAAHKAHAATLHPGQGGPEALDHGLPVDEANQDTQLSNPNVKDPSAKERKANDKTVGDAESPAKAQAKGDKKGK